MIDRAYVRPRAPGRVALALLVSVPIVLGCASDAYVPSDLAVVESAAEETTPLAGPALGQRRGRMLRMQSDLIQMRTALEGLRVRGDRRGLRQLRRFVDAYMGLHLEPLLRGRWQSRHPELMALDASLRLLEADVLIHMRENGRAQRVIDETRARFRGRETMLVDYPVGEQSTLADALERLRNVKWRRRLG